MIWFYAPQWYWFGWRTLLPAMLGSDEYNRRTLVLGWNVTGRAVVALTPYTSLRLKGSPKMVREALIEAQALVDSFGGYLYSRADTYIDHLEQLIDECDRHRPLGPDGNHRDLHTRTCGCEDK